MNVYRREVRSSLKSTVFWFLGVLLFLAASMQKYQALGTDPASLNVLNELPQALRDMFGVGVLDFAKISGFYGMVYPFLVLMAAVHASMLGAVTISKEERDKTAEFLFAKPASRASLLGFKALSALTAAGALDLVIWASSLAFVRGGGEDLGGTIARLMAGLFMTQLTFLALGVASAAVVPRPKAAAGIATGAMMATYLLSVAIDLSSGLRALRAFTPFQYFDARRIVGLGEGLDPWFVALCLILTAALTAAACLRFTRRDLKV